MSIDRVLNKERLYEKAKKSVHQKIMNRKCAPRANTRPLFNSGQ